MGVYYHFHFFGIRLGFVASLALLSHRCHFLLALDVNKTLGLLMLKRHSQPSPALGPHVKLPRVVSSFHFRGRLEHVLVKMQRRKGAYVFVLKHISHISIDSIIKLTIRYCVVSITALLDCFALGPKPLRSFSKSLSNIDILNTSVTSLF